MPRPRGPRTRVALGVYRDAIGYSVQVTVGTVRVDRRFPPGTSLAALIAAREDLGAELRRQQRTRGRLTGGTLAADAVLYLQAVAGMPTIADRARFIGYWADALGTVPRAELTAATLAAQLAQWQRQRKWSARTVNHARTALMHLYHVLDGKSAPNPVRDVKAARVARAVPREIPLEAARRLVAHVRPGPTRSVLWLMLATGVTPTEVQRMTASDVRNDRLHVPGRRKGQGSAPRALPLSRHGRAAVRSMARTDAWGRVTLSALNQAWQHALLATGAARGKHGKLRQPGPYAHTGWTPYMLRHTYLSQVARIVKDERVVQYLAGHSSITTTRLYTLGSVPDRVSAAAELLP